MRHPSTLRSKSKSHVVTREAYGWTVTSGTSGTSYDVWRSGANDFFMCSCDWAKYRPADGGGACGCSHVIAVVAFEAAEIDRSTQVYNDPDAANRQHRHIINIGDGLIMTTRKAR